MQSKRKTHRTVAPEAIFVLSWKRLQFPGTTWYRRLMMQKLTGFNTVCRWICGTPLLALVIALMLSAPSALHAQFNSVIDGRVSDPSDSAVPNAEVTVANQATGVKRVVRTSDVGYYRVASFAPGQYSISVTP